MTHEFDKASEAPLAAALRAGDPGHPYLAEQADDVPPRRGTGRKMRNGQRNNRFAAPRRLRMSLPGGQ